MRDNTMRNLTYQCGEKSGSVCAAVLPFRRGPLLGISLAVAVAATLFWMGGCQGEAELNSVLNPESTAKVGDAAMERALPEQFVAGRLLVKFREGSGEGVERALAAVSARQAGEIQGIAVKIVELPAQADERAALQVFRSRPEVEFVELDRLVPPDAIPNDPYYGQEWHLTKIAAPSAWDITTGSPNVIIAILDSGVDGTHPDLSTKMVPGWNFYNNNADTSDVNGHGTGVAGAATALGNNSTCVASVAWNCKLMPMRISDPNGSATFSAAANALTWAADHGARVANISYIMSESSTVTTAAQYFQNGNGGGVVTISAGNYATFSASPDNPNVLTVSATDQNDVLATWSNTGNNIDLAAPGVNIYTTTRGGGYGSGSGTSFSAPVVAGVAALVLSVNPGLTGQEVQDVVMQSADDRGAAGWDPQYGWGRVNAAEAVSLAAGYTPPVDATPPTVSFAAPGAGAAVSGTYVVQTNATDDTAVASVSLSVDNAILGTNTVPPYNVTWDTTRYANGSHSLSAVAKDAAGNTASTQISVTVSNVADATPPTVTINAPANGAKVQGTPSVTVSTSDNVKVVRVDLFVDGLWNKSSTVAPFTNKWATKNESRGAHTLQCKAFDAAGNSGLSQMITVSK